MGIECLLDVVRALGMGDCLSFREGNSRPLPKKVLSSSSSLSKEESSSVRRKYPGRMLSGGNDLVSLFTKQGKKGVNQDAMVVWENFGSKPGTIFCGVFDGHGPCGHMVSRRVRDALPFKLSAQLALNGAPKEGVSNISSITPGNSGESALTPVKYEDEVYYTFQELKDSFRKAFKVMDKELKLHPSIDCTNSGCTAVTLVKQGKNLAIGNVGDSRAVLGTRDKHNSLIAVQLTVDLKPSVLREAKRIHRCKGRVFAHPSDPKAVRVWMPNSNSPGLAMTRALGDFCLKDYGVISVPEVSYRRLTNNDEFIVLATDGIWDVLSNEEVVCIVASVSRSSAARLLVETAVQEWNLKYPTSKADDCAVVCLFLNSDSYYSCSSKP